MAYAVGWLCFSEGFSHGQGQPGLYRADSGGSPQALPEEIFLKACYLELHPNLTFLVGHRMAHVITTACKSVKLWTQKGG